MSARTRPHRRPNYLRVGAIAAIGLAVLLALQVHVAQRYLIPSRSMEPTLHGDPRTGDIVLVDKVGLWRSPDPSALQRFDTVVLRDRASDGRVPLVKRVVSTGDEMLRIADGDVFVRPLSGGPWQRVQKDPIAHRDLRFTFYEHRAGVAGPEPPARYLGGVLAADGAFELTAASANAPTALEPVTARECPDTASVLSTLAAIDLSFVDVAGRRSSAGTWCGNDIGIELDVELTDACRGIAISLAQHGRKLAFACDRSGRLAWHDVTPPAPAQGLPLGRRVALAFGCLDGRLFLEVDGALAALVPCDLPAETESERNTIRVAVAGEGRAPCARVTRVRLFHDVHYQPENSPFTGLKEYRVEPHEVFLLGDNTFESTDSRKHGPFAAADIIGRPVAVIGPWRRAHWLAR